MRILSIGILVCAMICVQSQSDDNEGSPGEEESDHSKLPTSLIDFWNKLSAYMSTQEDADKEQTNDESTLTAEQDLSTPPATEAVWETYATESFVTSLVYEEEVMTSDDTGLQIGNITQDVVGDEVYREPGNQTEFQRSNQTRFEHINDVPMASPGQTPSSGQPYGHALPSLQDALAIFRNKQEHIVLQSPHWDQTQDALPDLPSTLVPTGPGKEPTQSSQWKDILASVYGNQQPPSNLAQEGDPSDFKQSLDNVTAASKDVPSNASSFPIGDTEVWGNSLQLPESSTRTEFTTQNVDESVLQTPDNDSPTPYPVLQNPENWTWNRTDQGSNSTPTSTKEQPAFSEELRMGNATPLSTDQARISTPLSTGQTRNETLPSTSHDQALSATSTPTDQASRDTTTTESFHVWLFDKGDDNDSGSNETDDYFSPYDAPPNGTEGGETDKLTNITTTECPWMGQTGSSSFVRMIDRLCHTLKPLPLIFHIMILLTMGVVSVVICRLGYKCLCRRKNKAAEKDSCVEAGTRKEKKRLLQV